MYNSAHPETMRTTCSTIVFNELLLRRVMTLLRQDGTLVQGWDGSLPDSVSRRFRWPPLLISADIVAAKHRVRCLFAESISSLTQLRYYSSKVDWAKLRPVVFEKIKSMKGNEKIKSTKGNNTLTDHFLRKDTLSDHVLQTRAILTEGVSTLLKILPIQTCMTCHEVYIGDTGHQIKSCHSFKGRFGNQLHQWTYGGMRDILVPLECYDHWMISGHVAKHDQTSEQTGVPAIIELCHQVAARDHTQNADRHTKIIVSSTDSVGEIIPRTPDDVMALAQRTLEAWETLRSGVAKLLRLRSAKICKHCSEIHIGSSVYRDEVLNQMCQGSHRWMKAGVDDLVPPKWAWHQRPQDPPVLVDGGMDYYGRAPAVVSLCVQARAKVPARYAATMKMLGLSSI